MRKIVFLLFTLALLAGCSSDNEPDATEPTGDYFRITQAGSQVSLLGNADFDYGSVRRNGDMFYIFANYGVSANSDIHHRTVMAVTMQGEMISYVDEVTSADYGGFSYYNYRNFPAHYFQIDIISIDEANNRIKMTYSGNVYMDPYDVNSENMELHGELDMVYDDRTEEYGPYVFSTHSIPQHCTASFNGIPWKAYHEYDYGVFTSTDAYKLEIHFTSDATAGSYDISPSSTGTYLRLSKFNPTTMAYDFYDITGTLNCTYREYHGNNNHSFLGTYSFTAVNPNNPTDVIVVSDGDFRSFQHF